MAARNRAKAGEAAVETNASRYRPSEAGQNGNLMRYPSERFND